MDQNDVEKKSNGRGPGTLVRFSNSEWGQIANDSKVTGQSIPALLREAYFRNAPLIPLMSKEDLKVLLGQLHRIGNNINQIARSLNSGFREGFNDDFIEIKNTFSKLYRFLTSNYGKVVAK